MDKPIGLTGQDKWEFLSITTEMESFLCNGKKICHCSVMFDC